MEVKQRATHPQRWVVGAAILTVLVAAAVVAIKRDRGDGGGMATADASSVGGSGGTAAQQRILRELRSGLPNSQIIQIDVRAPPRDFQPTSRSVWLAYTIRASNRFDAVRGYWQALLVSGLFREESQRQRLASLHGHSFRYVLRSGVAQDGGSVAIGRPLHKPAANPELDKLAEIIRAGAARANVSVVGIHASRIRGAVALEITVRSANPRSFLAHRGENISKIVGRVNDYEHPLVDGTYLEVRDREGSIATVSAYSTRTGAGGGATDPTLDSRTG